MDGLDKYQGSYTPEAQFCKVIGDGEMWSQKPMFYIQDT